MTSPIMKPKDLKATSKKDAEGRQTGSLRYRSRRWILHPNRSRPILIGDSIRVWWDQGKSYSIEIIEKFLHSLFTRLLFCLLIKNHAHESLKSYIMRRDHQYILTHQECFHPPQMRHRWSFVETWCRELVLYFQCPHWRAVRLGCLYR